MSLECVAIQEIWSLTTILGPALIRYLHNCVIANHVVKRLRCSCILILMLQILDAKKTEKETKKVSKQTENETKKVGHKPHPYRRNNKTERKKKGVSKEQLDKPSEMRYYS